MLARYGVETGEPVRFKDVTGGRWQLGVALRVEDDGSLGIRDRKGAWRAIAVERVEVQTRGRRGAKKWEPLVARASRTEQLRLL
jgi:hypothetical protein